MKIELIEGGKMPERMTSGAVGFDCYARDVLLHENGGVISLGFKVDCDWKHTFGKIKSTNTFATDLNASDILIRNMNFGAFLFPRSGWARKYGFKLKNTIGVIDPDYRGEVIAEVEFDECPPELLIYASSDCNGCKQAHPCKGCSSYDATLAQPRVCQMVFMPCYVGELMQVDELGDTERGDGGFGSTDK